MTIYRVEDSDGYGPYWGGALGINHRATTHRPSPETDGINRCWNRVFAFRSLGDLLGWFGPLDLAILELQGYLVKRYQVDPAEVIAGSTQLAVSSDALVNPGEVPFEDVLEAVSIHIWQQINDVQDS